MSESKRKPPKSAWKKGQSGNPTGKPRSMPEVRAMLLELTPHAVQVIADIAMDETKGTRERLHAAKAILEYALPKPTDAPTSNPAVDKLVELLSTDSDKQDTE